MSELYDYGCSGTLTIGGILLNTPAWDIPILTALWVETEQRGEDRVLPGVVGVLAYRRRETVTRHDLSIIVIGDVDQAGTPYLNSKTGLATNLAYLETNIVQPTELTDGTRAASLTVPGLTARTAAIHILGLRQQEVFLADDQAIWTGTLQISIPAGRFV